MYSPGQIVFGLESLQAIQIGDDIWNNAAYPEKTTHFRPKGRRDVRQDEYCNYYDGVACPKSKELAEEALRAGIICIQTPDAEHCPKCGHWKHKPGSHCNADKADGDALYERIREKFGSASVTEP